MIEGLENENCVPQPATKAVKVTKDCDGVVQRMKNDDAANLFEIMKQSSVVYQDVSFPANYSSLSWTDKNWNPFLEWKRAFDIRNFSLWGSKGILPAGVVQGDVGNCWWVAVASALAEHPERIEKIFSNVD